MNFHQVSVPRPERDVQLGRIWECSCKAHRLQPVGLGQRTMQLPDATIEYNAQGLLAPPPDGWTPLAELQSQHLLPPARLRALSAAVTQVRSQVTSERELVAPPPDLRPLEPGFIDLPQKL